LKHWLTSKLLLTDNVDWVKVKSFDPSSKFKPNRGYSNKAVRVTVPFLYPNAVPIEEKPCPSPFDVDFHHRVIVKIMKVRKRCRYALLFSDFLDEVKGKVDERMFKRRIEYLLDIGFIQRDVDESDVFIYID